VGPQGANPKGEGEAKNQRKKKRKVIGKVKRAIEWLGRGVVFQTDSLEGKN